MLDPDVVLRADFGRAPGLQEVRGANAVIAQAQTYARLGVCLRPALVNGVPGGVALRDGELFSVAAFTVRGGRIVELDFLADPARLRELDLTVLDD